MGQRSFANVAAICLAAFSFAACDNGLVRYPGDEPRQPKPPVETAVPPQPDPVPPAPVEPRPVTPAPTAPDPGETSVTDPGSNQPLPTGDEAVVPPEAAAPPPDVPSAPPAAEPVADTPPDPVVPEPTQPEPAQPEPEPPTTPPAPISQPEQEPAFSYFPAGSLTAGSGTGSQDTTIYAPDMVFPILDAPAYPQSMVWGYGGGVRGGDQCDARNYEYPWRDNFCEKRSSNFNTPTCPTPRVHLGQDIRVGTPAECEELRRRDPRQRTLHKVVAAEDGVISNIGSYTVTLRAGPRVYRYLHLNMRALQVSAGDTVEAGQLLGYVSNDFGGTPTTFHLHFEIRQNLPDVPWAFVPPYTSLVRAYERREGAPGREVELNLNVASAPLLPPEGFIIVE